MVSDVLRVKENCAGGHSGLWIHNDISATNLTESTVDEAFLAEP